MHELNQQEPSELSRQLADEIERIRARLRQCRPVEGLESGWRSLVMDTRANQIRWGWHQVGLLAVQETACMDGLNHVLACMKTEQQASSETWDMSAEDRVELYGELLDRLFERLCGHVAALLLMGEEGREDMLLRRMGEYGRDVLSHWDDVLDDAVTLLETGFSLESWRPYSETADAERWFDQFVNLLMMDPDFQGMPYLRDEVRHTHGGGFLKGALLGLGMGWLLFGGEA